MSKKTLTAWMPMADSPPPMPGIYNVSCRSANQTGKWYAHFDGEEWSGWETIHRARSWRKLVDTCQNDVFRTSGKASYKGNATWRGLAQDPEANS